MASKTFSQLRARIAIGASSLVGVQGYLTGWYWQRSLAAGEEVPLLAALTQRCCMNSSASFCQSRGQGSFGSFRNARYYGLLRDKSDRPDANKGVYRKRRILPGSYFGSKAEQSSWQRQSFPLSVQAALPAAPRAPPFARIRHGSFLSSRGSLPATTFSTPLSSTPSGLSQSLGALGEHSASRAPGASRTLASTLGSPLTAEVLSGTYRWGRASREIPHNHSKPPEADPESSGDIERRALSKQAEFSGRSSEILTSFLSSPSTFKLSKETTSARGPSLHHVPHRQLHTSTAESEAAPSEHSQMDPPFLYRASTARPREVEVQQNRFGGHDRDVRGMHVQTKTAEPGQEAEWLFGSAGYAGARWTSLPNAALERFNWDYSRQEPSLSSSARLASARSATLGCSKGDLGQNSSGSQAASSCENQQFDLSLQISDAGIMAEGRMEKEGRPLKRPGEERISCGSYGDEANGSGSLIKRLTTTEGQSAAQEKAVPSSEREGSARKKETAVGAEEGGVSRNCVDAQIASAEKESEGVGRWLELEAVQSSSGEGKAIEAGAQEKGGNSMRVDGKEEKVQQESLGEGAVRVVEPEAVQGRDAMREQVTSVAEGAVERRLGSNGEAERVGEGLKAVGEVGIEGAMDVEKGGVVQTGRLGGRGQEMSLGGEEEGHFAEQKAASNVKTLPRKELEGTQGSDSNIMGERAALRGGAPSCEVVLEAGSLIAGGEEMTQGRPEGAAVRLGREMAGDFGGGKEGEKRGTVPKRKVKKRAPTLAEIFGEGKESLEGEGRGSDASKGLPQATSSKKEEVRSGKGRGDLLGQKTGGDGLSGGDASGTVEEKAGTLRTKKVKKGYPTLAEIFGGGLEGREEEKGLPHSASSRAEVRGLLPEKRKAGKGTEKEAKNQPVLVCVTRKQTEAGDWSSTGAENPVARIKFSERDAKAQAEARPPRFSWAELTTPSGKVKDALTAPRMRSWAELINPTENVKDASTPLPTRRSWAELTRPVEKVEQAAIGTEIQVGLGEGRGLEGGDGSLEMKEVTGESLRAEARLDGVESAENEQGALVSAVQVGAVEGGTTELKEATSGEKGLIEERQQGPAVVGVTRRGWQGAGAEEAATGAVVGGGAVEGRLEESEERRFEIAEERGQGAVHLEAGLGGLEEPGEGQAALGDVPGQGAVEGRLLEKGAKKLEEEAGAEEGSQGAAVPGARLGGLERGEQRSHLEEVVGKSFDGLATSEVGLEVAEATRERQAVSMDEAQVRTGVGEGLLSDRETARLDLQGAVEDGPQGVAVSTVSSVQVLEGGAERTGVEVQGDRGAVEGRREEESLFLKDFVEERLQGWAGTEGLDRGRDGLPLTEAVEEIADESEGRGEMLAPARDGPRALGAAPQERQQVIVRESAGGDVVSFEVEALSFEAQLVSSEAELSAPSQVRDILAAGAFLNPETRPEPGAAAGQVRQEPGVSSSLAPEALSHPPSMQQPQSLESQSDSSQQLEVCSPPGLAEGVSSPVLESSPPLVADSFPPQTTSSLPEQRESWDAAATSAGNQDTRQLPKVDPNPAPPLRFIFSELGGEQVQPKHATWQEREGQSVGRFSEVLAEWRRRERTLSPQERERLWEAWWMGKRRTRGELVEQLGKVVSIHKVRHLMEGYGDHVTAKDASQIMKALRLKGAAAPAYLFFTWACSRPDPPPGRYLVAQAIPAAAEIGMLGEVERLLIADLTAFRSRGKQNDDTNDVSGLGSDVSDLETGSSPREPVEDSELGDGSISSAQAGVGLTETGAGLGESEAGVVVEAPLLFDTFVCNALLEAYVDRGRWQEALGIFDRMQPPVGGSRQGVSQGGAGEEPSRGGAAEEALWGGAAEESTSAEVEAWGGYDDLEDWAEEGDLNRGSAEEATGGRGKERDRGGTRDEGKKSGRPEILCENYGWLEATFQEWLHEDLKRRSGLKEWKDGLPLELPRGLSGLDVLGPRDVFSYNLAMRACLRGRLELARIWALRDQMEREGLQPDRVSYNLTIAACCKLPEGSAHFNVRARGEDALLLIDEMERRGLSPNVYTYTAAIDAWGKANQAVSRALRTAEPLVMVSVFERMLHDGEKPNVVTYGALINGFAQMGALEDAEVAFESLLESGIPPNDGVVNALLAGCELAGDFEKARAWVERLERGGVHSSDKTRTRLLSVCVNTGSAEKVVEGCETLRAEKGSFIAGMRTLCEEVVGPPSRPDATLPGQEPLSAEPPQEASSQQDAVLHVETLEPSQAVEIQPTPLEATSLRLPDPGNDVALYKVLIQALAKAGRPEGLAPVLREMAQSGCLPDIVAHNIVLDACSRVADWEVTDAIVDSLGQIARAAAQQEAHVLSLQGSLPQQGQSSEGEEVRALQVPTGGAGAFSPWQAASVKPPQLPASFFLASSELLASRVEDDIVKQRAHKLLSVLRALGERPETVLAFFSSLCDALWSFGWEKRVSLVAGSLLGPGFQRGFKDRRPLSKASDREWALDVRRLGKGAGQAVLFLWLQRAREEFLAGEKAPTTVAVVTGWGGQKWGRGELAEVIAEQLEALGSPFRVRESNPGRLSAYGYEVRDWLMDGDVAAKLVLSDGTGESEEALEEAF